MTAVLHKHPLRAAVYGAAFVLLAAVFLARSGTFSATGETFYGLSIMLAVGAALLAGDLALQRFRAEQRDAFLLVSAGLWVAAVLHLYHFVAYTDVFGASDSGLAAAAALRGALLPALLFSSFLGLSLLASREDRPSAAQPGGIYLAAATLAFIVTAATLVFPVPPVDERAMALGQPFVQLTAQPELALAIALTLAGIVSLLRGERWRVEPYGRWLLLAFVLTLVGLLRFPMAYAWESAAIVLLAQFVVIGSYLCVAVGIILRAADPHIARAAAAVAPKQAESSAPDAEPAAPSAAQVEETSTAPQRALHELQPSHRALRNAVAGLIVGVRADGAITDWKPAADFGLMAMPSDLMGKNIRDVLPADQSEAVMAVVARALQAGSTERIQYLAADGSAALGGRVTPCAADRALCIIHDETAQAQALRERDEARRTAKSLRRVTPDWLIRMTSAGAIEHVQPPAAESASYGDMFAGKSLPDLFQGDDVAPLLAGAAAAVAEDSVQEISFERGSGQALAARIAPLGEDSVLCLLRDVTELRETAAQLAESEEANEALRAHLGQLETEQAAAVAEAQARARVLHTLLPDLVLRLRTDGTILECKPAESFGPRDGESLVGAKVRERLPVDLASHIMAAMERVAGDGQPHRFACHPVGGQVLAGGMAALTDDQFLCVVRDQTQQKQMETALAQQAAVLAQEMQARLEAEALRTLRSENSELRAHLRRVAELALAGGPDAAAESTSPAAEEKPGDSGTELAASEPPAPRGPAQPPITAPPPDAPPPAATDQPQPPSPTGPASGPPHAAGGTDTHPDGTPSSRGVDSNTGDLPRNSAEEPKSATQTRAAVVEEASHRSEATTTPNGQPNGQVEVEVGRQVVNGVQPEPKQKAQTS